MTGRVELGRFAGDPEYGPLAGAMPFVDGTLAYAINASVQEE